MERIVRKGVGTYTITGNLFDGEGVDVAMTGVPTVVLYGPDGAAITDPATSVAVVAGDAIMTIPVAAAAYLGAYNLVVDAEVAGVASQWTVPFELVGGFYFEPWELRIFSSKADITNTTTYPDAGIVDVRTSVEQTVERFLRYALVPRGAYVTVNVNADGTARLPHANIRTIVGMMSMNGTVLTPANYTLDARGGYIDGIPYDRVSVWYEHGDDEPERDIVRGVMKLAIEKIVGAGDPRVRGFAQDGVYVGNILPGDKDHPTGLPELDSMLIPMRSVRL